jgi:hypothetical protein
MNRSDLDAQHGYDLAEDGGLIGGDRRVGGVLRHQPHMTVDSPQGLTVASASPSLVMIAATISPFSATDCLRTTTRSPSAMPAPLSGDLQREQRALPDQPAGQPDENLQPSSVAEGHVVRGPLL